MFSSLSSSSCKFVNIMYISVSVWHHRSSSFVQFAMQRPDYSLLAILFSFYLQMFLMFRIWHKSLISQKYSAELFGSAASVAPFIGLLSELDCADVPEQTWKNVAQSEPAFKQNAEGSVRTSVFEAALHRVTSAWFTAAVANEDGQVIKSRFTPSIQWRLVNYTLPLLVSHWKDSL